MTSWHAFTRVHGAGSRNAERAATQPGTNRRMAGFTSSARVARAVSFCCTACNSGGGATNTQNAYMVPRVSMLTALASSSGSVASNRPASSPMVAAS